MQPGRSKKSVAASDSSNSDHSEAETPSCPPSDSANLVTVGCTHGQLDTIYHDILTYERDNEVKVDLLLCCGDFEACRNEYDLSCLSGPAKYHVFKDFYKYYNGEKRAPVLTVFIGGNHEACNHLRELYYGGWAAPNIYFLGYSGVVQYRGVRIAGFSGIYKGYDFSLGHYEVPPYGLLSEKKSAFHVRSYELWKLKHLKEPVDIVMSVRFNELQRLKEHAPVALCVMHDWPNVIRYGDSEKLLRKKPWFREDAERNNLGTDHYNDVMKHLKPKYWLSGHMHCKFEAEIPWSGEGKKTLFRALDKPLPRRPYLDYLKVAGDFSAPKVLCYDPEWLAILRVAHGRFPKTKKIPSPEKKLLLAQVIAARSKLKGAGLDVPFPIPVNFQISVEPHVTEGVTFGPPPDFSPVAESGFALSKQTMDFLAMLELDPVCVTPPSACSAHLPAGRRRKPGGRGNSRDNQRRGGRGNFRRRNRRV